MLPCRQNGQSTSTSTGDMTATGTDSGMTPGKHGRRYED
jgi:hypothetical protein